MTNLGYSRMIVIWIALGIVLLDSYLIYQLFIYPYEYIYLLFAWLTLGIEGMVFFGLTRLWNTPMEF
jgi:hypothetical protein